MKSEKQWGLTPFREPATIKQSHAHADTTLIRHAACFGLATITENAWRREEKTALQQIHA
jgi:hypothetical protein